MEDVQGDDFNFCSFWMGVTRSPMGVTRSPMGVTRSPMGVTRQWWVLTIALLKSRVYVRHHKVFEEHPLTAGSLIIPHQGYIHRYTPCLTVHYLL